MKTKIISAIFSGMMILTTVSACSESHTVISISDTLSVAQRFLSEMKYEQAIIEFDKILSVEPKNVEAYLGKAEAYIALGDTESAIKVLQAGLVQIHNERLQMRLNELTGAAEATAKEESATESTAADTAVTAETEYDDTVSCGIQEDDESAETPMSDFILEDNVIMKYNGSNTRINIPKGITGIDSFQNDEIKYLFIPETVTYIDIYNLCGMSRLIKITVDENNQYYCDIDGVLFSKNKKRLLAFPQEKLRTEYSAIPEENIDVWSYDIPAGTEEIGDFALQFCEIQNINIPDTVKKIGERAFYCNDLKNLTLPDSITEIGNQSFLESISKTAYPYIEIVIPGSIKEISFGAFEHNDRVEKIVIQEGVEIIGEYAFGDCDDLKEVIIPESVQKLGEKAFDKCDSLHEITIPHGVDIHYSPFGYPFDETKELIITYDGVEYDYYNYTDYSNLESIFHWLI